MAGAPADLQIPQPHPHVGPHKHLQTGNVEGTNPTNKTAQMS